VVDDDADTLEVYRRVLESVGYRVAVFVDADEALEEIRREVPALVITDLMMKSIDSGFVLSRSVKTDPALSTVKLVVATAASRQRGFDFRPRGPEDLQAMCVDAFFSKPVDPRALIKTVTELIESRAGQ
jgi:CheY-like chemotaxis protein